MEAALIILLLVIFLSLIMSIPDLPKIDDIIEMDRKWLCFLFDLVSFLMTLGMLIYYLENVYPVIHGR